MLYNGGMFKIVKKNNGEIRKIAINKTAINLITKEITPTVSLAIINATSYQEIETTLYNRVYFVIKGTLVLTFDNNKNELIEGDSCFIAKGTTYTMSGTFETLVINQPAFGV